MAHLLTPQFKLPFRVVNGEVECIEQDSGDDVYQNVVTVMRYRYGDRSALPNFGIPEPALREVRTRSQEIVAAVRTWEPDADVALVNDIVDADGTETLSIAVSSENENA